ncbi:MAG: (E)-4-hydroxy-3-methylbut-2-enyl-diphosphate synthase [Bacteroidota bacterium]|jgi:(E)-4-hydroxy-3-methylbut-2-enyl-diphosphate synthase
MTQKVKDILSYCESLSRYKRRKTVTVKIGELLMGSDYPIRAQSMTTTDTMDTSGSVEQIIRMVDAGCELVRLTAPSINEANNLANIKAELNKRGIHVPLVADIHFTPNAAEAAARIVEKVRINPGNYVDKKKFQLLEYTDAEYHEEIERIRQKFIPLVGICKEYGTAMRIGTNHGSLSDRIMSRYGDTPLGMVESAMEFLRIAEAEGFHNIVLSMKSSNPQVMVEAYRLLVQTMNAANMHYPLHLGVTEAGDGDDGRIKSAMGIGALLEDGIGDTVRVSLTEDPEFEIPVAKKLIARYTDRAKHAPLSFALKDENMLNAWNPFAFEKRVTEECSNLGGSNVPRVIADLSNHTITPELLATVGHTYTAASDKWLMADTGCDYIYFGKHKPEFMLPMGVKGIIDAESWQSIADKHHHFPYFTLSDFLSGVSHSSTLNFIGANPSDLTDDLLNKLKLHKNVVIIAQSSHESFVAEIRNLFCRMKLLSVQLPVIIHSSHQTTDEEQFMLDASTQAGTAFIDGFGDGIMLSAPHIQLSRINQISFGILQAARARITKTEYISCPSCGRTLFDLQETTAMIRKQTDHLKGVKIAIMGCIVNGPGEMADADYGYVGSGPGKITLYRSKEVVKKGINKETAVQELIELIRADGRWIEVEPSQG